MRLPPLLLLALAFSSLPARAASGGAPLLLSHSGYLLGPSDQPINAPGASFTFSILDAATDGNVQWTASCAAAVTSGYYEVVLGDGACAGDGLDTADVPYGTPTWLEVTYDGTTLAPRARLTPLAIAAVAGRALTSDKLGTLGPGDVWGRTDDLALATVGAGTLAAALAGKASSSDARLSDARPVSGTVGLANGGTGLVAAGSADQLLGVNGAGGALEYKTVAGTANQISVTHAAGALTLSTPQSLHAAATPTFAGLTLNGALKLGAAGEACGAADTAGRLKWEADALWVCNGTTWQVLARKNVKDGTSTRPAESCLQILADGYSTGNGRYYLTSDTGSAFPAYCDMLNGGWTLLAVDRVGNFSNASTFWDGALGSSTAFTWGGIGYTTGDLEAVIRSVPFEELRLGELGTAWWVGRFADRTTFKSKKARKTGMLVDSSPAYGCGWDRAFTGTHTAAYALFACEYPDGYGDHRIMGFGAKVTTAAGGAACISNCDTWYTFGQAGHRGFALAADGNSGAWIR